MRKAVWISFAIALILVNLISEVGEYYTGIHVHMFLRIALVFAVTIAAYILAGATILVAKLDEEVPLSGHVRNTLGADRKQNTEEPDNTKSNEKTD
jgi:hypothetical protein